MTALFLYTKLGGEVICSARLTQQQEKSAQLVAHGMS